MDPLAQGSGQAVRQGRLSRFCERLLASWPPLPRLLLGGLLWGALMALSGLVSLYSATALIGFNVKSVILLYFAGGLIGWFAGLPFASFAAHGHRPETRFCAFFLFLSVATVAITAFFFALDYRLYYAQWHAPFATRTWLFQFVFTTLGAAYQFAVIGMRHYFPLGLTALVIASFYLARRVR